MMRSGKFLLACLAVALIGSSMALGGSTLASKTIKGCVNKKTGVVRVAAKCAKGERKIVWNTKGANGPRGFNGVQGAKGDKGDAGQNGQDGAHRQSRHPQPVSRVDRPLAHNQRLLRMHPKTDGLGQMFCRVQTRRRPQPPDILRGLNGFIEQ